MKESIVKCVIDNSILENISNIATLVISAINLLFVISVYRVNKKEYKLEKIKNHKYEWYKMINVQIRVETLNEITKNIKQYSSKLIDSLEDSTDKRTVIMSSYIDKINDEFYCEKANFTYLLKSISKEKNIELSQLYNKYQDEYLNILIVAKAKEDVDISKLQEIESEISDLYYNIGLDLIK